MAWSDYCTNWLEENEKKGVMVYCALHKLRPALLHTYKDHNLQRQQAKLSTVKPTTFNFINKHSPNSDI